MKKGDGNEPFFFSFLKNKFKMACVWLSLYISVRVYFEHMYPHLDKFNLIQKLSIIKTEPEPLFFFFFFTFNLLIFTLINRFHYHKVDYVLLHVLTKNIHICVCMYYYILLESLIYICSSFLLASYKSWTYALYFKKYEHKPIKLLENYYK